MNSTHAGPEPAIELRLALAFATALNSTLDASQMRDVVRKNLTPKYESACASHDYCDANVVMAQAFETVFARPFLGESGATQADTDCWNKAWDLAKGAQFSAELLQLRADDEAIEKALHEALDAASLVIQRYLGVTTGDFAGAYFSGVPNHELQSLLRGYLEAERRNAAED